MILNGFPNIKSYIRTIIKYYSFIGRKCPKPFIVVPFNDVSGRIGLADRLRHCLSVYLISKEKGLDFKILHHNPFTLESILVPNKYNWIMKDSDFSNTLYKTRIIKIRSYYKSSEISEKYEEECQADELRKFIDNPLCQYHIYGNAHIKKTDWSMAFNELFRPSPILDKYIENLSFPSEYDAVTFRFQQLLGDFKEIGYPTLPEKEQVRLINTCIEQLELLKTLNYFKTQTILVTSDSARFIQLANNLSFVKIIPGTRLHPSSNERNDLAYINSFLDLFMLKNAKSITLMITGQMYESGFPEFASYIGNNEFRIHRF